MTVIQKIKEIVVPYRQASCEAILENVPADAIALSWETYFYLSGHFRK